MVIVQRRLTHYRVPLFRLLRRLLADKGIGLELVVGDPGPSELSRGDEGRLSWAIHVPTRYLLGERICWLPIGRHVGGADLVVLPHENRLIYNLVLLFSKRQFKVAFWGHGRNFQSDSPHSARERFKRWYAGRADWWFAYNSLSVGLLVGYGFDPGRITDLRNTIDTRALCQLRDSITPAECAEAMAMLGCSDGDQLGVFLGSLYPDKRLDFLIDAAKRVRAALPRFRLVVMGDGPERDKVLRWTGEFDWVTWTGAMHGRRKAAVLSIASIMLNPGLVGLAITDAMVFGVPLVTSDCGLHSPEIAYLESGRNGLFTAHRVHEYAEAAVELLRDRARLAQMHYACRMDADKHTIEEMADRFADGIQRAIDWRPEAAISRPIRVAMVTNIPAPYRVPIYNRIARDGRIDLTLIFCADREPNRQWDFEPFAFRSIVLKRSFAIFKGRYIHNNPDVWGQLRKLDPDVVVTTGFNPTFLYAWAFALRKRRRHVAMTDGTLESEATLSIVHRWVRRIVFKRSSAFIGASNGSRRLFDSYAIPADRVFSSYLCADNDGFRDAKFHEKRYDLMFCGRFAPVKQPNFALEVAQAVAEKLGRRISILFVGDGEMIDQLRRQAASCTCVEAVFNGFASQRELPGLYGSSRVFLFPTLWDPWGVVVNEACAAGLPVISSEHAGVAGELVVHGENGYIPPLVVAEWATAACRLLADQALYARFSATSLSLVSAYRYDAAAEGIVAAALAAVDHRV